MPRGKAKPQAGRLKLAFVVLTLDEERMMVALKGKSIIALGTPGQVAAGIKPLLEELYGKGWEDGSPPQPPDETPPA